MFQGVLRFYIAIVIALTIAIIFLKNFKPD